MKKSLFMFVIAAFITVAMITGCQSTTEKTENTTDQLKPGIIAQDSVSEYQKFKKESEEKISVLEKSIADFKTKIATGKEETKAEYEKQLASLEQKNNDLKKKLEDYHEEGQDNWEIFKAEFSRDMDELGKAFKDLTVNNIK